MSPENLKEVEKTIEDSDQELKNGVFLAEEQQKEFQDNLTSFKTKAKALLGDKGLFNERVGDLLNSLSKVKPDEVTISDKEYLNACLKFVDAYNNIKDHEDLDQNNNDLDQLRPRTNKLLKKTAKMIENTVPALNKDENIDIAKKHIKKHKPENNSRYMLHECLDQISNDLYHEKYLNLEGGTSILTEAEEIAQRKRSGLE